MPSRQILRGAPAKTKPTPRGGLWSRSLLMRLKRECTEERAAAARFAPVHAEVIAAIGAFRGHRRHRVVQVGRERRIKDLFVVAELVAGSDSACGDSRQMSSLQRGVTMAGRIDGETGGGHPHGNDVAQTRARLSPGKDPQR